jgi:hypothetical protein
MQQHATTDGLQVLFKAYNTRLRMTIVNEAVTDISLRRGLSNSSPQVAGNQILKTSIAMRSFFFYLVSKTSVQHRRDGERDTMDKDVLLQHD